MGSVQLVVEVLVQESARRRQVELAGQQVLLQQVQVVQLERLELRRMESSMERRCMMQLLRMSKWVRTVRQRIAIRMQALRYKSPANSCFV
jgi:hypothetical protein